MAYKTIGSSRSSAKSAVASSIVVLNSPEGFKVAGSSVSSQTPITTEVVTPGQVAIVTSVKPSPTITAVTVTDSSYNNLDDTDINNATGGYAKIIGTGFVTGAVVYVNGSAVTATFISSTEVRIVVPSTPAGTYSLMLFNPDGNGAVYLNLQFSSAPSFSTPAGTLGTVYEFNSTSTNISASGDVPLTYSLFSGSLPPGVTLASNGVLSGTTTATNVSSTYSFVIKVEDPDLQETTRSFSLTIVPDVVTWVNPASNSTISISGGDNYSTNLSATSAAGKTVTYQASNLPTGITLSDGVLSGTYTGSNNTETSTLTAVANDTLKQAVSTITWSISFNDIYFNSVTKLLSGIPDVLPFITDSSTNNFNITAVGDTKPNNYSPLEPGYYSNIFDGTGDFLTIPGNVAFNLSSGSWTVECWFYQTSSKEVQIISSGAARWRISINTSQQVGWLFNTSSVQTSNNTAPLNRWNHVAVCYNGTTCVMYLNGVAQTATGALVPASDNASVLYIGRNVDAGSGWDFNGYISNARIVKGTAVYTANFTPPTAPLTAIAGTTLLTCQSNRFIDNSTNNFTITVNGNTAVNPFVPFVPSNSYATYGSGYFDGTGDYLSVPAGPFVFGTNSFTVEAWVYTTAYNTSGSGGEVVIDNWAGSPSGSYVTNQWQFWITAAGLLQFTYATGASTSVSIGTGTVSLNTWTHIAVVRNSTTVTVYINGVASGSGTVSQSLGVSAVGSIARQTNGPAYTYTGNISNTRIVNGTAVYTTDFTPPTIPLTAITNTSLLTLQTNQPFDNSTFLDDGTLSTVLTRAGNLSSGSFTPNAPTSWSGYFDGTGDSLSITGNNAALGNIFTIEMWVYPLVAPSNVNYYLGGATTGPIIGYNGATFAVARQGTWVLTSPTNPTLNAWNHIAVVREGTGANQYKLYLNGVLMVTGTEATTFTAQASASIGGPNAYISNLRIVNGTAVYTANFTPPTTPLAAIANTSLLTLQDNRFIDDSPNNFTFTRNGDTRITNFNPFGSLTQTAYYSNYFDGTGDSLTFTGAAGPQGTEDFTVEMWAYISVMGGNYPRLFESTTASSWQLYLSNGVLTYGPNGGSAVLTYSISSLTNQWLHICLTRSGSAVRMFVNGVLQAYSASGATNFAASTTWRTLNEGGGIVGYISNLRVVRGSVVASYSTSATSTGTTVFAPSTTPLTAISGTSLLTCQSATFIDNSTNNFAITVAGNPYPKIISPFTPPVTTNVQYSAATHGASAYFDGSGDYLTTPANAAFTFGTGDLTLECWIYQTATSVATYRVIFGDNLYGSTGGYTLYSYNNALNLWKGAGPPAIEVIAPAGTINLNAWTHVAWTRSGSSNRLFINGIQVGATTTDATNYTSTRSFIGASQTGTFPFSGYISDARIIKGQALYTSQFVPPVQALTAVQNTVLLANFNKGAIIDASTKNTLETVGNARISTAVSKFGSSSIEFDGNNDYIKPAPSEFFTMGTGNFTYECWVNRQGVNPVNSSFVLTVFDTRTAEPSITPALFWESNTMVYYVNGANRIVSTSTFPIGTWVHVAIVRSSGITKMYVNGVQEGANYTDTNNYIGTTTVIGGRFAAVSGDFRSWNGYIQDLRITKGIARYTANFTAPTSKFILK